MRPLSANMQKTPRNPIPVLNLAILLRSLSHSTRITGLVPARSQGSPTTMPNQVLCGRSPQRTAVIACRVCRLGSGPRGIVAYLAQSDFARTEIINGGFYFQLTCLDGISYDSRRSAQQVGLNLCIGLDGFVEITARLFHGLPKVLVQSADLARDGIGLHRSLHCSTTAVAKYEKSFDAEDGNTIFEAPDDLWGNEIPGHACDKDMANR